MNDYPDDTDPENPVTDNPDAQQHQPDAAMPPETGGGGEESEKEELDPEIPARALEELRGIVKGNGLKTSSLDIESYEGEILNFEAYELFKLEPQVSHKVVTGKVSGEAVKSRQDAQSRIDKIMASISQDHNVKQTTIGMLKKRSDLGFGIDGQTLKFDKMQRTFVKHDPCAQCDSRGKIECHTCHGYKRLECPECHGNHERTCPQCDGRRFMNTAQGQQQCTRCHGQGRISCTRCKSTGYIPCHICKGKGATQCGNCNGSGWHTDVSHLQVRGVSRFELPQDADIPEDAYAMVEQYRARLATEGHAEVRIIDELKREKELNAESKSDEYRIPYHVRLPWGAIKFKMKNKDIEAGMFGFTPLLLELPPILELTMARGLQNLKDAARESRGQVGNMLTDAVRFKAIKEIVQATARTSPKRAAAMIAARYPYGLNDKTPAKMAHFADTALKRVTQRPRQIGLGIGLGIIFLLYAAYYIGPGRAVLLPSLPGAAGQLVADIGIILLGGTITTVCIQLAAINALKDALGLKNSNNKKMKIMPKPGVSALWGYIGGLLLYFFVLQLSVIFGKDLPEWYSAYLNF